MYVLFTRKKIFSLNVLLLIATILAPNNSAFADSIYDAMAFAYKGNPELNAQRAATRAADEGVPLARSGYFPVISGNSDFGYTHTEYSLGGEQNTTSLNPRGFGVVISQSLFDGFLTSNNVHAAKATIKASRETLRNLEQNILFDAASAYMNVLRDRAIASFRKQSLVFLREEVRAANERFKVGENTRTDVSQAKARKSAADAQLAAARAQLQGSIATYRQIIGRPPSKQKPAREISRLLPRNMKRAIAIALKEHPAIHATQHLVDQAAYNVKSSESALLPRITLEGSANRRYDSNSSGDRLNSAQIVAKLVVPIYQGGKVSAQVRQNKEVLGQRRIEVDKSNDQVRAAVVSAFSQLEAAKFTITAGIAELSAARLALAGVVEERNVGQRTTLDVLNTQQNVINAQITLANARRDSVVAGYALLSAIGRLSAKRLNLKVAHYAPQGHYQAVKDKWYGLRTPDQR